MVVALIAEDLVNQPTLILGFVSYETMLDIWTEDKIGIVRQAYDRWNNYWSSYNVAKLLNIFSSHGYLFISCHCAPIPNTFSLGFWWMMDHPTDILSVHETVIWGRYISNKDVKHYSIMKSITRRQSLKEIKATVRNSGNEENWLEGIQPDVDYSHLVVEDEIAPYKKVTLDINLKCKCCRPYKAALAKLRCPIHLTKVNRPSRPQKKISQVTEIAEGMSTFRKKEFVIEDESHFGGIFSKGILNTVTAEEESDKKKSSGSVDNQSKIDKTGDSGDIKETEEQPSPTNIDKQRKVNECKENFYLKPGCLNVIPFLPLSEYKPPLNMDKVLEHYIGSYESN